MPIVLPLTRGKPIPSSSHKAGTADIWAKKGQIWAPCKVTVTAKTFPVTNVTFDKNILALKKGDTETLTTTVYAANAINKNLSWSSGNSNVASVDAIPRFEMAELTVKNSESDLLFYRDEGKLFVSGKNKLGYVSRNGKEFFILEWEGEPIAGIKTGASLRTNPGVSSLKILRLCKARKGNYG